MRYLRYFGRLILEIFLFARKNKAWWLLPIVIILLLIGILIFVGSQAVPTFIYTLF